MPMMPPIKSKKRRGIMIGNHHGKHGNLGNWIPAAVQYHAAGNDGFEVFTRVKQIPRLPSTTFIFLTAKSTRSDIRTGMDMGVDDYLTKPFTKEELINSIRARLEKLSQISKYEPVRNKLIEATLDKMTSLTIKQNVKYSMR